MFPFVDTLYHRYVLETDLHERQRHADELRAVRALRSRRRHDDRHPR
ncbi:MAG: hypothetical protein AAFP84_21200 [Actinomycetota bacterium]